MKDFLNRLLHDSLGATAVEYGLIVALIFLAIAGGVASLGKESASQWSDISERVAEPNEP